MTNCNTEIELKQQQDEGKKTLIPLYTPTVEVTHASDREERSNISENFPDGPPSDGEDPDSGMPKTSSGTIVSPETEIKSTLEYAAKTKDKPTIYLEPAKLDQQIDAAEGILCAPGCKVYQRGGAIVVLAKAVASKGGKKERVHRKFETTIIKNADVSLLTEKLTKYGSWCKRNSKDESVAVNCPEYIARHLMSRQEWKKIPLLNGIILAPTLRCDGSILEDEGYDEDTGVYLSPNGCKFEKIPESPTKADAKKALDSINDLLKDFPFEDEASKSVAISAIFTSLLRKSLTTAPLHAFSAPKMGSGKSLITEVTSIIATGNPPTIISQAENEGEESKRILSVLQDGAPVVCIDNVEKPLGSASLCAVLTCSEYSGRLLGATKMVTYPTNITFLVTGNNLRFAGDMSTRALLCKLDPRCEYPEERKFDREIKQYVLGNRGRLIQASLTILRAYALANWPEQNIKPFGRFEEWSNWIRAALVWLGCADPNDTRKDIEREDPVRIALGNLLEILNKLFGKCIFTTNQIIEKLIELDKLDTENATILRDALVDFCPDRRGDSFNISHLGKKLKEIQKRIERGLSLQKYGDSGGKINWRIIKEA